MIEIVEESQTAGLDSASENSFLLEPTFPNINNVKKSLDTSIAVELPGGTAAQVDDPLYDDDDDLDFTFKDEVEA